VTKNLFSSSSRAALLALALGAALSLTGCLILSGRPVNDFGATCRDDGDCASFGFCGAHPTYGPICLPLRAECTVVNDVACGGYSCELKYGSANAFCKRSCNASVDCVSATHSCAFSAEGDGVCKPL
jgi:hypothetical protein